MKRGSGLGGEVEELSDVRLKEVVGAAAIDEDSEVSMVDNIEEAKGFRRRKAGKGMEADVGRVCFSNGFEVEGGYRLRTKGRRC